MASRPLSRYADDAKVYAFAPEQMRSLDSIRLRLYEDKPLTGDQRRDLANKLDALMHGAIVLEEDDAVNGVEHTG